MLNQIYRGPAALTIAMLLGASTLSPVRAATLQLTGVDSVAISGSGTLGAVGGSPVNNAVSSYTDADNSFIVGARDDSTLSFGPGAVVANTGSGHGVYADGNATVTVAGGTFTGSSFSAAFAHFSSQAILIGAGTFNGVGNGRGFQTGNGAGAATITGGNFLSTDYASSVYIFGGLPMNISGGAFSAASGNALLASSSNLITISGGAFSAGGTGNAVAVGNTAMDIIGGTITATDSALGIYAHASADVRIAGGSISANGIGISIVSSTVTLYGSNFVYTPQGGLPVPIVSGEIPLGLGTITGTLLHGGELNTTYGHQSGTFQVNVGPAPIPEPAGLFLLALGGLALTRRRRW